MRAIWLGLVFALAVPAAWAQGMSVNEPWVREAPPSAQVMAGYLTLHNGGREARSLVGVTARGFDKAELHRTVVTQGVARMERITRLAIEPGANAVLEPGSYHLMLMQPHSVPATGEHVAIELQFDDGSALAFEAPVQRRRGDHGADHDHQHGHGHGRHHAH